MKKLALALAVVLLGAVAVIATAIAKNDGGGGRTFHATLNGFNEVVGGNGGDTGSVSTLARGTFKARVKKDPLRVEWELKYSGIEGGNVTAAHPHFAQRHVGGNIFLTFCSAPACPATAGTVTGTITEADITGPVNQGVQAGATNPGDDALTEFIRAMRAGAVYVNVHSPNFADGEIRGQVQHGHRGKNKDD